MRITKSFSKRFATRTTIRVSTRLNIKIVRVTLRASIRVSIRGSERLSLFDNGFRASGIWVLGCNVRFRAQGPGLNIKGAQGLGLETLNANPKPSTPNTLNSSVYPKPLHP